MPDEYIRKQDAVSRMSELLVSELHMTRCPTWNEVYNAIGELPSADVAPVVHGRWENYSPITIKCSRCGYVIHDWRYSECKYCPNCGAKMDAQGEE